ncbi:MAG TPA: transcription termination factor Rho [Phycisphaerae bacterium]|nr:transcription termination factor Rho [Phycisphaerae bacterium]
MADNKQERQQQERPQAVGMLEITEKGHGYLRMAEKKYRPTPVDPYVPSDVIKRTQLRAGLIVSVNTGPNKRGPGPLVTYVNQVEGMPLREYFKTPHFQDLIVVDPRERIKLETVGGPASMRIMDLLTPIGRGQRGLIVAPPKTGKTTLLKQIAEATNKNHPDMKVYVLLIDERPEEVTDFRRSLPQCEVWASNTDEDIDSHVRTARMVIERAKRLLEFGQHVMVILDSITRVGRAFNHYVGNSGKTMSGGIDAQAMQEPRSMFGAARNIEHAGSLTIIASALIDTGSRMDELIFQEFKGTGNMELVLTKKLAERRTWPAIDLPASGTRKEALLLGPEVERKVAMLRRDLVSRDPVQGMESLLKAMAKFPTNEQFLSSF